MKTEQIIRSSANVLRITELNIGDTFKLVNDTYSQPEIYYGIVIDILNSGDKTFIHFLQYDKRYSALSVEMKLYSGDKDIVIFPATPEEIKEFFAHTEHSLAKSIEEDQKKLEEKKESLVKLQDLLSGESKRKIQAAKYEIITPEEMMSTPISLSTPLL